MTYDHECLDCGYFDADNSPEMENCPACGNTDVLDFGETEEPMTNNPVESEQHKLDAKAWEEFALSLIDGERHIKALPITETEKETLVATFRLTLNVAELIEGQ